MIYPRRALYRAVLCALASANFTAATAQEVDEAPLEEVLVTGTLIRGIEATGSQTISLDSEAILEVGAITTNELLASIPQVSNFFNQRPEQDPRGADRLQVNRPNLRNLPGINSASGATTLILVDGHRLTPVGTDQSSLDPDVIPTGVMRSVEVLTDGGSSLYGADAVGGVINFVTIDEFDGVEVDFGYDTGDAYDAWQASVLAGTSWDTGSGYISLSTTDRDAVLNNDRDWAAIGVWDEEGRTLTPDGTECLTPVGATTTWFWFGSGWTDNPRAPGAGVTPVGEPCDINGQSALLPKQERDNLYAGLTQRFGDKMTLTTKGYYMDRKTTLSSFPLGDTVSEPTPTDLGIVGENVGDLFETSQVGFSYGAHPAFVNRETEIDIETWGITPELTIDIGNTSWQSRNTLHYGQSDNSVDEPLSNRTKLVAAVNEGAVDPLNIAAADAAVIDDILNWRLLDEVDQEMFSFRSIADGDVLELPAGTLRAAVGLEYSRDEAEKRDGETTREGSSLQKRKEERDVKSAFAELSVPLLQSLDLSLSVRYDDYSDFGDTTNPSVGFSYAPLEWVTLFGKWGESFNAPTVIDRLAVANGRFVAASASVVPDPNGERTDPSRDDAFILEGGSGDLEPQTADIKGLGLELRPLQGLELSIYYYEIDFKQLLGAPNPQSSNAVRLNPDKFIFEPTQEEWEAFLAEVENADQFSDIDPADLGVIVDRRSANTEEAELRGYDFGIRYGHDSKFGFFSYGLQGNRQTRFKVTQSGNLVDQLDHNPDLFLSANLGWSRNHLSSRLTFKYTDHFDADPELAVGQSEVNDFLVTDLFVAYDFGDGSGLTNGLALRLNVDNLFDLDPPKYRRQQIPNSDSFSLGRVFKFGVTYTF